MLRFRFPPPVFATRIFFVAVGRGTSQLSQPKAAAAAPKPAAAPAPAPSPAPTPAPAAPPAPAAASPAAAAAPNADHVRQLTEMGFPEDQATAALRAAMGNPDVAVEFLMTGIPDNIQVQTAQTSMLRIERRQKVRVSVEWWFQRCARRHVNNDCNAANPLAPGTDGTTEFFGL